MECSGLGLQHHSLAGGLQARWHAEPWYAQVVQGLQHSAGGTAHRCLRLAVTCVPGCSLRKCLRVCWVFINCDGRAEHNFECSLRLMPCTQSSRVV